MGSEIKVIAKADAKHLALALNLMPHAEVIGVYFARDQHFAWVRIPDHAQVPEPKKRVKREPTEIK